MQVATSDKAKLGWEEKWCRLKYFNQTFSGNVSIQENRFKVVSRWYLTPRRLTKFFPQIEENC